MIFLHYALKSIARQKARSAIVVTGVALGTLTIVVMVAFAWGFERNFLAMSGMNPGELVVARMTKKTPLPSAYDPSRLSPIRDFPEVEAVMGSSWEMIENGKAGRSLVLGWEFPGFLWESLTWIKGGVGEGEEGIYLGEMAADQIGADMGGSLNLAGREYRVLGIYRSASLFENGAILMGLGSFQKLLSSGDKIRYLHVRLRPGTTEEKTAEFRERVQRSFRGFRAVPASELAGENPVIPLVRGSAAAISFLSFLIAALGVANAALATMHERRLEVALLGALGWSRARILTLVLGEFLVLGVIGSALGAGIGVAVAKFVATLPQVAGSLFPILTPDLVLVAIGCGVICALLGAVLPALATISSPAASTLREQ